ncbi:MAG TPA: peptidoglycan-binding domain-containing protein [Saprospiraceae bacterium]|nr:peptidoglycan-binding domain-containing protein [Saprospiraceae bacterium]HMP13597.1 peptidoglycan-binding domain-containing protein [Saprospiraceae bacterium]
MSTSVHHIQSLLQDNLLSNQLSAGSKNPNVKSLQQLLYEMGFGQELNWDRSGADGTYGASTARAVQAFALRNGLNTDGKSVNADVALKILERHSLLPYLKLLLRAIHRQRTEDFFQPATPDAVGTQAVELSLRALGFVQSNVSDALREFAQLENLTWSNGSLNTTLAKGLLDCLLYYYGDNFTAVNLYESVLTNLQQEETTRNIIVSLGNQRVSFIKHARGYYQVGNHTIKSFIETKRHLIQALNISDSAINVMLAVSENEGNFDAINTWDNAFLSIGIFQWTLGERDATGELPALLRKIKAYQPEIFDEYFGQYGVDIDAATNSTYGFLNFRGNRVNTTEAKNRFRLWPWGFRFWLAGQDDRLKAIQIEHALSRLKNFYWNASSAINGFLLSQIITSEYGVGLILDNHVNRPGYVRSCIERAMRETGLLNPTNWTTAEERRVLAAYLTIRETFGSSPMTHAQRRAAVTKRYLDRGVISDARGSFRYTDTPASVIERSASSGSFSVLPPSDFDEADYPVVRRGLRTIVEIAEE